MHFHFIPFNFDDNLASQLHSMTKYWQQALNTNVNNRDLLASICFLLHTLKVISATSLLQFPVKTKIS